MSTANPRAEPAATFAVGWERRVADTGDGPDIAGVCSGAELAPTAEDPTRGEPGQEAFDLVLDHRLPHPPRDPPSSRWKPTDGATNQRKAGVERLVELALEKTDGAELQDVPPLAAATIDRQQLVAGGQGVAGVAVEVIGEPDPELDRAPAVRPRGRGHDELASAVDLRRGRNR